MSCNNIVNIGSATRQILVDEDFIEVNKEGTLSVKADDVSRNKFKEWQNSWITTIKNTYSNLENVTNLWNFNFSKDNIIQLNEDLAKRIDEERFKLEKGGLLQGTKTGDIRGTKYTSYNGFPFSNDRLKKLDKGDKTATVRPKNHPTGIYKFNNQEYLIENKGFLAFNELENSDEFLNNWIGGIDKLQRNVPEYKHIENWVDGEGKQYVYSIKKLTTEEASLYKEQESNEEEELKNDINKTNERIQFAKDLLVIKINGLKNRIESNTGDKELQNKHKEYLESLLKQLEGEQAASGIMSFVKSINKEVISRLKYLEDLKNKDVKLSSQALAHMRMFLNISEVIREFQAELNTNKNTTVFPSKVRIDNLLRNISHRLTKISDLVNTDKLQNGAEFLIDANNPTSGLTIDDLKKFLTKGFGDVSWLSAMLGVTRDSIDPIIALMAQKIQKSKFFGRIAADKANKNLSEITDKLIAYYKTKGIDTNNHLKLYDKFLEKDKDGNPTGFLIKRTLEEEFFGENPNATKKEIYNFYKSNKIDKKSEDYIPPDSLAFRNLSNEEKEWYDAVLDMRKKSLANIGQKISIYKIPTVKKKDLDVIKENGLFSTEYWESIKDKFTPSKLDYEYSQAQDLSGNPINSLPIYFNSKLEPEVLKDLSYNLTNSFMLFNSMAYTHGELNKIVDSVENVRDLLANRDVVVTSGGLAKANKFLKGVRKRINPEGEISEDPVQIIKGKETNSFKQLEAYLDQVFYNKPSEKAFLLGKDVTKTIDTINKYTAFSKLSLNILQSGSQVITGSLWRKIESIGGDEFTGKELNEASVEYAKDTIGLLKDSMNTIPKHKINALRKYLGVGKQKNGYQSDLEKLLNPEHTSVMNNTGDHMLSSVTMIAMMKHQKVKNSNGEEITLWEAIDINDNGDLLVKDGVEFTDKDAFILAQKISTINRQIDGTITQDDQNAAKRNPWARAILFMRNWVHPSYSKRFGYTYDQDGNIVGNYNQSLGKEQLGYYTDTVLTTIDFIKNITSEWDSKRLAAITASWNKLTVTQKKNLYKTGIEISLMAATTALALAINAANDDDDEEKNIVLSTLSVMMFRASNEMAQYLNPTLTLDMLKSPAASISIIESSIKLANNLVGWKLNTEEGFIDFNIDNFDKRTGELNLIKPFKKNIPFWHTVDQFQNMNTHKSLD